MESIFLCDVLQEAPSGSANNSLGIISNPLAISIGSGTIASQ